MFDDPAVGEAKPAAFEYHQNHRQVQGVSSRNTGVLLHFIVTPLVVVAHGTISNRDATAGATARNLQICLPSLQGLQSQTLFLKLSITHYLQCLQNAFHIFLPVCCGMHSIRATTERSTTFTMSFRLRFQSRPVDAEFDCL